MENSTSFEKLMLQSANKQQFVDRISTRGLQALDRNLEIFPYFLSFFQVVFLRTYGISVDQFGAEFHSHPVHFFMFFSAPVR
jgi:hypothetical protein